MKEHNDTNKTKETIMSDNTEYAFKYRPFPLEVIESLRFSGHYIIQDNDRNEVCKCLELEEAIVIRELLNRKFMEEK